MTMKARVRWLRDVSFVGQSGSGHSILMDGPPEAGGEDLGLRPMEAMLVAMGGCSAFDVVTILKKGRQAVTDCVVDVVAERAEGPPRVFTKVHLEFLVEGRDLNVSAVKRAVDLSAEKYCSATMMLRSTVDITHSVEIVQA